MNLNAFFNDLAANGSRNYKIEQLEANRDNETLREVIRLALDPFTQFYQRKIPDYTQSDKTTTLANALGGLFDLSHRVVTGNAAIEYLRMLLSSLDADDAKVLERIIQKDLKCGVSVSTANAVWTGLVSDYPVMLCSQLEQKLVDKVQFPAMVQLKMDGMRFNAIVRHTAIDSTVEYRSRNGKEIQLLGNLDKEFIALSSGIDCVFDGELLVVDNGVILDRQTGNGILNKANKGTITPVDAAKVEATIWDVIPYAYFVDGYCSTPYGQRFESLCGLHDTHDPKKINLVDWWEVENITEANTLFECLLAQGEEGIILKDNRGVWENKRSKTQIKFKGGLECDLKIVDIEEGSGKYTGLLGAVICESSDGVVKVNVGSGFNDEQRKTYGRDLIGKIVAVKYNMRIKNKVGEESLFLPVFVEVRSDKDVADSSEDIRYIR